MKEEKGIDLGIDLKQPQLFYEKSDELKKYLMIESPLRFDYNAVLMI